MFQLIIAVIAIALSASVTLATINYIPWWHKVASNAEEIARTSLKVVEQAYDVASRANNGVPPAVIPTDADGGFAAIYTPVLKILPPPVPRFAWKYGEANGLNYFCMEGTGQPVGQGAIRGIYRAKAVFSDTQVYVNTTCGAQSNFAQMPTDATQIAVTMYVAFVPGISK